ncbi:MAG: CHAT domain-containing protein [Calothrix sp. FI2-JRJ7]|nr:CHAT domain-containing protein [Calothrix sp. FI2-JRJ7]
MQKLILIKFSGDFDTGFNVNLEIANEAERAYRTVTAKLPANMTLKSLLLDWQTTYQGQYGNFRIKAINGRSVNIESLNKDFKRESQSLLKNFNSWLNSEDFSCVITCLKEFHLQNQDEVRAIICSSCHELRQLPWHLWGAINKYTQAEVALSSPNAKRGERALREKIRILIILGDTTGINVDADKVELEKYCGEAEIVLLKQPPRQDLIHQLQDDIGWDILFFSGHSRTHNQGTMSGRIFINSYDSLTMGELNDALQVAIKKRLQIAFFNSCDGLGIAYELEQLHIPQVIVMREPVPDQVAQIFLKSFLLHFTSGKSLYTSVKNARQLLRKQEQKFPCASWLPVIIQNQTETPPTWQSLGIISFCPYQGLAAFSEKNAQYFFGREQATSDLVAAVNSKPLVAVVGASGSGKSSLVFAGLIPQLRSCNVNNWQIISFRPLKNPLNSLTQALQHNNASFKHRLLLVIDQFEEIFTLCTDTSERKIFLDTLLDAINNSSLYTVVLTLRIDFLSKLLDYEPFGKALKEYQQELVVRMNTEELKRAITLPATKLGFEFEPGLCQTIINHIQDGEGRLPLLEFTLTQLWKQQQSGRLTHQAYQKIGRVEQALANYAEAVYTSLSEEQQKKAQQIFIQLVQPGEGTEDTRKLATREDVLDENWDLVTYLASERLVVTNIIESTFEETVELVHEALIQHWGRLSGWMLLNRKFRSWQEGLKLALQQWIDSKQDNGALLRGAPLAAAEEYLQKRSAEISKPQQLFIKKSIGQRQKEKYQRRSIIAGLVFGVFLALSLAGGTVWQQQEAKATQLERAGYTALQQFEFVQIEALLAAMQTGQQLQDLIKQPLSFIKNNRSTEKYPAVSPLLVLQTILDSISQTNQIETYQDGINSVSFDKNGKTLATGGKDGTVKLWDLSGNNSPEEFKAHDNNAVKSVRFSLDEKYIATAATDGTAKLWDAKKSLAGERKLLAIFKGHQGSVNHVRFTPDGKRVVTSGDDGTVRIWNLLGRQEKEFQAHTKSIKSLILSKDGKQIVSSSEDGTAKLWDLNGALLAEFKGHQGSVNSVQFSSSGMSIATAGEDGTVIHWDLSGKEILKFRANQGSTETVRFSKGDEKLITSGKDGTLKTWNLQNGELLKEFRAHQGSIESIRFNPTDERILATVGKEDSTIRLWNLQEKPLTKLTRRQSSAVSSIRFNKHGKLIATSFEDGKVILWSRDGKYLKEFDAESTIQSVRFSPDGRLIATGGKDDWLKIWEIDSKLEVKLFKKPIHTEQDGITSINFGEYHNAKVIATLGKDGTLKLWNINSESLHPLLLPDENIKNFRFSSDDKIIATGDNNGLVKLWSNKGEILQKLEGHKGRVNTLNFGYKNKQLATSGDDGTVRIWDTDSGKQLVEFKTYQGKVENMTFSEDGKLIATGSTNRTVRLWTSSGKQLAELRGHQGIIRSVNFSPDSKFLGTASEDGAAIIWQIKDLNQLINEGCTWLQDYFNSNPEEQKQLTVCKKS